MTPTIELHPGITIERGVSVAVLGTFTADSPYKTGAVEQRDQHIVIRDVTFRSDAEILAAVAARYPDAVVSWMPDPV